jgi:hypothetical protein
MQNSVTMRGSILNKTVSGFADVRTTTPVGVNLLTWLTSDKYRQQVEAVREAGSKEERTKLKQQLPCITPSGIFSKRNTAGLIKHSSLLCLDIDAHDNSHIENFSTLKEELSKIGYFAYIGRSVSGSGFYCLMPITQPQHHKQHFRAIQKDMARHGVILDVSGSDVTRLRFYSFDSTAHFNHHAKPYSKMENERTPAVREYIHSHNQSKPLDLLCRMIQKATDGEKHFTLYKASRLAGGFIAGGKISESEAVQVLENEIRNKRDVLSLSAAYKTIQNSIKKGMQFPIYE